MLQRLTGIMEDAGFHWSSGMKRSNPKTMDSWVPWVPWVPRPLISLPRDKHLERISRSCKWIWKPRGPPKLILECWAIETGDMMVKHIGSELGLQIRFHPMSNNRQIDSTQQRVCWVWDPGGCSKLLRFSSYFSFWFPKHVPKPIGKHWVAGCRGWCKNMLHPFALCRV